MGIYDRHYIRDARTSGSSRGSAIGGMKSWSVNVWLIVICIGVFVIDGFLPQRFVFTGRVSHEMLTQVDPNVLEPGTQIVPTTKRLPDGQLVRGYWRELKEKSTGRQVGWGEVYPMKFLESYLHFSTKKGFLGFEYWRFIGFQFLHASLSHLLFNMIALFFFGGMVEQYLGSKRYLAFYLLCGMCGAIFYLTLNLGGFVLAEVFQSSIHVPGLLFNSTSTPLVGASAGIFGVLMAGAYLAPKAVVLVFFILPMQLRTLAYALVIVAFVTLVTGGYNAGGEAGHLGGAIAGLYFIRRPHHLHGFFDFLGRVDPTSHHYRDRWKRRVGTRRSRSDVVEVDRILDKIHTQGLHSLSETEKRILREASREEGE